MSIRFARALDLTISLCSRRDERDQQAVVAASGLITCIEDEGAHEYSAKDMANASHFSPEIRKT